MPGLRAGGAGSGGDSASRPGAGAASPFGASEAADQDVCVVEGVRLSGAAARLWGVETRRLNALAKRQAAALVRDQEDSERGSVPGRL